MVEIQVRSPRFKDLKKGFKSSQGKNKNCLGCNASPISLSANTIRRIGSELYNIGPAKLTDEVLKQKRRLLLWGEAHP